MQTRARYRWRLGAALWALTALFLPLQFVVALWWPDGYSLSANAISDLGVTSCGVFDDGSAPARAVCSPWHALFNVGVMASGVVTTLGAVLLYGRWPDLAGRIGVFLAAASGVFVVVVGFAPWDLLPGVHDAAALAQAATQWLAMLLLASAAGRGLFRRVTVVTVVVSVASFLDFLLSLDGQGAAVLPLGIAERLAFDTLVVWTAGVGVFSRLTSRADLAPRTRHCPAPPDNT